MIAPHFRDEFRPGGAGAGSGEVLEPGSGYLEFRQVRDRSVTPRARARNPLHLRIATNLGAYPWAYVTSFGGGIVGGDHLDLQIRVGPAAAGSLLSQASTKVYRSARVARQRIQAHLGADSRLLVLPDPLVAFAGSRLEQEQSYTLGTGASLLLAEALSGGRLAAGERWAFGRLRSCLRIQSPAGPLLIDSLLLDPAHGDLALRLGRFNALGLICLVGPAWSAQAQRLHASIAAAPIRPGSAVHLASGPLGPDGVLLRLAATSSEALVREQRRLLDFVPAVLGDDPWARKG